MRHLLVFGVAALTATVGCQLLVDPERWSLALPEQPGAASGSGGGGGSIEPDGGDHGGAGGDSIPGNATCADGLANGLETDVDCGGDACLPCPEGKACDWDNDCQSANCADSVCGSPVPPVCSKPDPTNPHCFDCTLNGLETDVDCGGDSCPPCAEGALCDFDADCDTRHCEQGVCVVGVPGCEVEDPENPSCGDCTKNGSETDVDCGGDACAPCLLGQQCAIAADCETFGCDGGECVSAAPACGPVDPDNPNCADCIKNGPETDVDCGGDSCPPCGAGDSCDNDADCASEVCDANTCL